MFKIADGRECFYQWDLDRRLIVEDKDIPEVHYCNKTGDCSLVVETYIEDGINYANVPNILLQDDWRINVYAYDKNYTKYSYTFNILSRTKPADYVYKDDGIKLGANSVSLGENVVGLKAYYISSIDFNNKKIYLTKTKVEGLPSTTIHTIDETIKDDKEFYSVGDVFSIINEQHYIYCGVITAIDENRVITYKEELPFSEFIADSAKDGHTFNVAKKAHIGCVVIGDYCFASGKDNVCAGYYANAFGANGVVAGNYGTTLGYGCTAGYAAVAEGRVTDATGENAHAQNQRTKALKRNSHAEGFYTVANCEEQHAQGRLNIIDTENKYAHIVGNGTSESNRKNIHTLDWYGNAWFNGDVYVGSERRKLAEIADLSNINNLGYNNKINANNTITIGNDNKNNGNESILIGHLNTSNPERSFILGDNNQTTGTGGYNHIIGFGNISKFGQSYIFGKQCTAAEYEQVVIGRNNKETTGAILVVGNGYKDTDNKIVKRNALEVLKSNNDLKLYGGIILTSPNGTNYRITVNDDGTLNTTKV